MGTSVIGKQEVDDPSAHHLFGQIEGPRNTRERILFVALDLFYLQGFHAVGLDSILDGAGLTKTTFYNHFQSKDDLVREAIALRDRWEAEAFRRALHEIAGYDPEALLLGCFDVLDTWFSDSRYAGCIFLMAMAEYPLPHHPVHAAAANHYLVTREEIAKMAQAADIAQPSAFARQWCQLLMGCVASFLLDRDPHAARVAKTTAEHLLAAAR